MGLFYGGGGCEVESISCSACWELEYEIDHPGIVSRITASKDAAPLESSGIC
jgi:hypothetical protein